jgi:PIN domain nuclease of toxin-antitoxin system
LKIGSSLGNVKEEKTTTEASYWLGKKFYYMGDKCMRIKGIALSTIDDHGNKVSLVDRSLYEDVYNWKKGDMPIQRTMKSLVKNLSADTYIATQDITRTINSTGDYKEYN